MDSDRPTPPQAAAALLSVGMHILLHHVTSAGVCRLHGNDDNSIREHNCQLYMPLNTGLAIETWLVISTQICLVR